MSDEGFVYLQAGMVIPVAAVMAALNIERAGHRLSLDGEHLLVEPHGDVDPDDLAQLRRWKPHVRMLLQYVPDDRHLFDATHPPPEPGPLTRRSRA
ncbi:MAG TPA: hypothetical protein VNT81_21545 [Vicinamibacterales bacterium]|nr:hypothetical protein [Vicinamibacterales bacterium]